MNNRPLSAAAAKNLILSRSHALALREQPDDHVDQARSWIDMLPESGWWADIDMADRSRNSWEPHRQMTRLETIAVLSGAGGPLDGDPAAGVVLLRGLKAWQDSRPRSDNWWYNEIGVPLATVQILASRPDLPPSLRQAMHGWLGNPLEDGEYATTFTGQNLAWRARIALLAAADHADLAAIQRAVDAMASTIAIGDGEGLQIDGSWHQHGAQFMTGSYGGSWVIDMARRLVILAGTPWALTAEQSACVDLAALDGLAWTLRGGVTDPAALGRTVSREQAHRPLHGLGVLAAEVAQLSGPRASEWDHLSAVARGERKVLKWGARCFWRSDASFLHRPGFSVGMLAATTRTLRVESINDEHLKGALHADGATWIRVRGNEFGGLTPVLPWGLLPGTVAATGTPLKPSGLHVPAESTFGAGIADGAGLVHGWDLRRDDLQGHQAWFAVKQGLVVLIGGVSHPDREVQISGPIMPRLGPVTIDGKALIGHRGLGPGQAMVHDQLAWLALDGEWEAHISTLRGNWRQINAGGDDREISVEAVYMSRSLGTAPRDGCGAWALLDIEEGQVPDLRFSVLANTSAIQAVQDGDGSILAVFRGAGQVEGLSSNGPAVVIARPDGRLIVADPLTTGQPRSITVEWRGTPCSIAFPGGADSARPIEV